METQKKMPAFYWLFILIIFYSEKSLSQDTFNTSGGDVTSNSGVIHFSIGQVFYLSEDGTDSYQIQGVQQPYSISIATGSEVESINLEVLAYPNPTPGLLQLELAEISDGDDNQIALYNLKGELLLKQSILSSKSTLNLNSYAKGTYLLKIYNQDKEIKSFKIIKQ